MNDTAKDISTVIEEKSAFIDRVQQQLSRVVVGQKYMINRLLIGLLTGGHVLLEGVPGLAKTLTVNSLSDATQLDFNRIQFTPDLLPADLVGTMIYNQKTTNFEPRRGPVFTNILLADEVNRAPAKVQSALLESMQEKQVTLGDETHSLPEPFLVLATQNPIEQEGTYPLPEAQLDRFMLMIKVTYPSKEEEREIMDRMAEKSTQPTLESVANREDIKEARQAVRRIHLEESLRDYIVDLTFASRNPEDFNLQTLSEYVDFGASPRASIFMNLAAKAHAFINRRSYVTPEDIKSVAKDILRHRIIVTFAAEAEQVQPEDVIDAILETVEVP
jgi:MoxR-like ATPase